MAVRLLLAASVLAVATALVVRRRRRRKVPLLTVPQIEQLYGALAAGVHSPPIWLHGLRVTHRVRMNKKLHFLGLRDAHGRTIEAALRGDALGVPSVTTLYRLGDAVSVYGHAEVRERKISIRTLRLEIDEAWSSLFGEVPFLYDWDTALAASGSGNVLLQVAKSHTERLSARLDAMDGVRVIGVLQPVATRIKHMECGMLIQADMPLPELMHLIRIDSALPDRIVQRMYCLDEWHGTLEAAVAFLAKSIAARSEAGKPLTCRVQAFPRSMERRFADALFARGVKVTLKGHNAFATVGFVCGAFATGLVLMEDCGDELRDDAPSLTVGSREGRGVKRKGACVSACLTPGLKDATKYLSGPPGGASRNNHSQTCTSASAHDESVTTPTESQPANGPVCRAYYKLEEAASYLPLTRGGESLAIDVGASPGGWTSYLALSGFAKVISVDPGLLEGTVLARPNVEHMRLRFEEALPLLLQRGIAGTANAYCCDMNAPPGLVVDLFLKALELMRPGAVVVITLKNAFPKKLQYDEAVAAALETLGEYLDGVRIVQLFANTTRESTLLGTVSVTRHIGGSKP